MFSNQISPKEQSSRFTSSFNDKSLVDVVKDELRQVIVREEEFKYQVQILEQQNLEIQKQNDVLHSKLQQSQVEMQKYQQQAKLFKEKADMLQRYLNKQSTDTEDNVGEIQLYKQELNKLQQQNQLLTTQLQMSKLNDNSSFDEILQKVKLVQQQCHELKQQNQDLIKANDNLKSENDSFQKEKSKSMKYMNSIQQGENEIELLKQKLQKLDQIYSQKLDLQDQRYNELLILYQNEEKNNDDLKYELEQYYQAKGNTDQLIHELQLALEQRLLENRELKCEYQNLRRQYDQVTYEREDEFQCQLQTLQGDKERLNCSMVGIQQQIHDFERTNNTLKIKLKQECEQNNELQCKIDSLEQICYQFKKNAEQSKQIISQTQGKLNNLQEQFEAQKQSYSEATEEIHQLQQQIIQQEGMNENLHEQLNQVVRQQCIEREQQQLNQVKSIQFSSIDKKSDTLGSSYYVGQDLQKLRYLTDQTDQVELKRVKWGESSDQSDRQQPLNKSIKQNSHILQQNSKFSDFMHSGQKLSDHRKNQTLSQLLYDPTKSKKSITEISPIQKSASRLSGTIKTTQRNEEKTKSELTAKHQERIFQSLVKSCKTSQFDSCELNKENIEPTSTKTLDQLQERYLNLRGRINDKKT